MGDDGAMTAGAERRWTGQLDAVARLCHPIKSARWLASCDLLALPECRDFTWLRFIQLAPPETRQLQELLEALGINQREAATALAEQLFRARRSHNTRLGCAAALGLLPDPVGILPLMDMLTQNRPDLYVVALHALARLHSELAIPLLAAFGLQPDATGHACTSLFVPAPAGGSFPIGPLIRAYHWFRDGAWRSVDPTGFASGPRATGGAVPPAEDPSRPIPEEFARDALSELGETRLLTAVRELACGRPDAAVALRDPRLLETFAMALTHRPRRDEERARSFGAMHGLLMLADPRGLAVLEWAMHPRGVLRSDPDVREQCRLAARCLRERLGAVGGELVPGWAPPGTGTEPTASDR